MDIPVNAKVRCADEDCGHSTYVVIDPEKQKITHVVVREPGIAGAERLVPIEQIIRADPELIQLRWTKEEFSRATEFRKVEFVRGTQPLLEYEADQFMQWPIPVPAGREPREEEREQIPTGEQAVREGARVEATDGAVGSVDGFLTDPHSGEITHLVMKKGHLWGRKEVFVPISEVDEIEEEIIYLKLDKKGIEELPTVPPDEG